MSHPKSSSPPSTPSKPMAIPVSPFRHARTRSASLSSGSSSSPDELPTPISSVTTPGHIRSNSANSPILSYFLSNPSPTATLKSKFGGPAPVFEAEEEEHEGGTFGPSPSFGLNGSIGRRTSLATPRIPSSAAAAVGTSPPSTERGAGLLRRLSLGVSALPPTTKSPTSTGLTTPPNTAVDGPSPFSAMLPTEKDMSSPSPARRARRRATVSSGRAPRAPSPMGERMLKGHFDGFN